MQIAKIIGFTALAVASLAFAREFLFVPLPNPYSVFYEEEKNSLDIVLLGNSTTREGYIPTLAYKEEGLTTFPLSASPTHLEVIKIMIDEVARNQDPSLVFVDINGLTFQSKENAAMYVKDFVEYMPNGEAKDKIIESYDYLKKTDEEYLFRHHNAFRQQIYWESLVYRRQMQSKGYVPLQLTTPITPCEVDPNKTLPLPEGAVDYLKEILEKAASHPEIKFVFGKMPRVLSSGHEVNETYMLRSVKPIIEEAGFDYIDWADHASEMGLNPKKDHNDATHLNHRGAKKFTRYFAKYMKEHYGVVASKKEKKVVSSWEEACKKYEEFIAPVEKRLNDK